MKKVQILMSVYNGMKYLSKQLESILSQRGVQISVLVRDDDSQDDSLQILRKYEIRHENISVCTGRHLGAAGSFYKLLQMADLSNDYFAFADQDDVWLADKIKRAVSLLELEPAGQPLLYAGKVYYASDDLRKREIFSYSIRKEPSFGNALVENICMGCTEVFNRQLLLLAGIHIPDGCIMHDWWMYLTAACFGEVVFDQKAYILYRQHSANQIGMENSWIWRWRKRILQVTDLRHKLSDQALIFKKTYAGLADGNYELHLVCNSKNGIAERFRLVLCKNICRQNVVDDIICRLLFIFGFL